MNVKGVARFYFLYEIPRHSATADFDIQKSCVQRADVGLTSGCQWLRLVSLFARDRYRLSSMDSAVSRSMRVTLRPIKSPSLAFM